MTGPRAPRLPPWARLVLLGAIVLGGLALSSWYFGDDLKSPKAIAARLDGMVRELGPLAPLAFVALVGASPFLFLPVIPLTIAAGAVFGPVWGAAWSLLGSVLAAVASFLVGRTLGRDFVERRATGKLGAVKSMIDGEGWRFVAFIRLVPLFPFGPINMTLGTTAISLRDYTIATAVFMAPGAIVFSWLGHTGREAARGAEHTLRNTGIAVAALLLITGIPTAIRVARYRRDAERRRAGDP